MHRQGTDGPVSPVARFRPFGRRQDGPVGHEPDPWLDDPPPSDVRRRGSWDRDSWDRDSWDRGSPEPAGPDPFGPSVPATRAATPAMWAPRPAEPVDDEEARAPVTDPFGFPPVPPVVAARDAAPSRRDPAPAWAAWVPERSPRASVPTRTGGPGRADGPDGADGADVADGTEGVDVPGTRSPGVGSPWSGEPAATAAPADPPGRSGTTIEPDPAEAAALAGAFAADYLSWDEDDPARRGRALSDHLSGSGADHALLGWSGTGRQRAEIVLPGAARPDGDGRLHVDVRVRVTPYRRVSRSEATPEPDPRDALGTPSAAPAVTARGWRGIAARWVRLGVTVARDGDRLVVDAGEETFEEPDAERRRPVPAPARPPGTADDPTLDGDDVVSAGGRR